MILSRDKRGTEGPSIVRRDRWSRRRFLAGLGAAGAAGCAQSPILDLAGSSFESAGSGYPMTRAQVDALPYASIAVRMGGAGWAILVLARYDGEDLHWVSADRAVIVTRHGRIVRTVGLARDLRHLNVEGADPVAAGLHRPESAAAGATLTLDVTPFDFGLTASARYSAGKPVAVTMLARQQATLEVVEHLAVEPSGWRTTNRYWVDGYSGFVWRTTQRYCAEVPAITIEVLKPAA